MGNIRNSGIKIPKVLVPRENIKMEKWSVVACDQFTSQPEYWHEVEEIVGGAPSMLHMILPEVYLNADNVEESIADTKNAMKEYINEGVLEQLPEGVVLTQRDFGTVTRKGVMLCVDLEKYHYDITRKPLIRATEKTLLERIPPRVRIREGALLESPHIMVLMDDPEDKVIGPLYAAKESFEKLYDFELMMKGGHLRGWFTDSEEYISKMCDAIEALKVRDGMKFCVGDGNHSLATAKAVWDKAKAKLSQEERENHPLRFALCEFVNIRDNGIQFMPIHRVLFNVNPNACLEYIVSGLKEKGIGAKVIFGRWRGGAECENDGMNIPFLFKDSAGKIVLEKRIHPMLVGEIQDILDKYVEENASSAIDYIHGEETFEELACSYDNLGLYCPSIPKDKFFDLVIECGVLPKKTFSMGEAEQKRYYTECRLLTYAADENGERIEENEDINTSENFGESEDIDLENQEVIVTKFGGSSLADAAQIEKMKNIVTADERRKYVVPSAPGKRFKEDIKVTDLLYKLYEESDPENSDTFKVIVDRFNEIKDKLGVSTDIESEIRKIAEDMAQGVTKDYAASRGEYLNGRLIADYLGYDFIDPKDAIFFDEKGVYDHEKTQQVLGALLKQHKRAVIPGFYGGNPDGSIKTFSRGGSDITGSIVACCADAVLYENWTDVSGFLMADPRVVENPKKIDKITYKELRELSYMGATVLHEDAIFPVLQKAIPINVKNTNDPKNPGTLIVPEVEEEDVQTITGIAGKKNFTVIGIEKNGMNAEVGFGRRLLTALEKFGLSFEHIPTGIDTMSVVIADEKIHDCIEDVVQEIHNSCAPDSIEVHDNMALIATVGRGMVRSVGVAAKLFTALAENEINIRMIDQGSSEMNIIVGVENDDFDRALRAIYSALA